VTRNEFKMEKSRLKSAETPALEEIVGDEDRGIDF
jgi:hypothetical protein